MAVALRVQGVDSADVDGDFEGGLVWSASTRWRTPLIPLNLPLTLEIIMCLTLNSAAEWAGSMFQVEVAVQG